MDAEDSGLKEFVWEGRTVRLTAPREGPGLEEVLKAYWALTGGEGDG